MSSRHDNNKEFAAIRDEFMTLMKDVNKDAEVGVAYRDAVDELDHAYAELDRLYNKLQKEKSTRSKLEQELRELKVAHSNNVDVASQELERKNREVAAAKAERDKMKEWLDRGVAECKRVGDEVIQLRKEVQLSEDNCAALAREKAQLTAHMRRLHDDLERIRETEKALHEERTDLSGQLEMKQANLDAITQRHREAEGRELALRTEVSELTGRVNRLNECEECLLELVKELGAATTRIKELDVGITSGKLVVDVTGPSPASLALRNGSAATSPAPSFRSRVLSGGLGLTLSNVNSALVDTPRPTSTGETTNNTDQAVVEHQRGEQGGPSMADTRELLHNLQDSVDHLNETVYRFIRGKQKDFEEVQKMQQNEIAALQRDKISLLASHEIEREDLKNHCRELEREITNVALTTDAYTDRAFARLDAKEAANKNSSVGTGADAAFSIGNIISAAGLSESPTLNMLDSAPTPRPVTDAERDDLFTKLQTAFREYKDLSETIAHLRGENARIRQKASRRKIDWVKVNDSRTRYDHLTKEVEMMKAYQRRLMAENEHLSQVAQMHAEKASMTPAELEAKRYRLQNEKNLSRIAFDEWKAKQVPLSSGRGL